MAGKEVEQRIVNLEDHKQELEEFIMRPLKIPQEVHKKLEQVAKASNKTPEEFIKWFVYDFHFHLIKKGKIKEV